MLILDRYIIRQFLTNFIILLVVFMALFVLGDALMNMDEFVKAGKALAERRDGNVTWSILRVISEYYGPMLVLMYVFFAGLLVVGAMGFTFAGLSRSRELTAMVASGINMHRIAMPVLVAGCLLNIVTIVNQELLIPGIVDKLTRSKGDLAETYAKQRESIWFYPDGKGSLFSAEVLDLHRGRLEGVTILERDANGQALRRIVAREANWAEGAGGWELGAGSAIARPGRQQMLESPGESPAQAVEFFATDLSPQALQARLKSIYPRLLSFAELRKLRDNPALDGNEIRQIMHARFSMLVINVLVLAMGMPFFLQRHSVNLPRNAVIALSLCVGAWATGLLVLQSGSGAVNPALAAWAPVVVFLPLTAVMMQFVRT